MAFTKHKMMTLDLSSSTIPMRKFRRNMLKKSISFIHNSIDTLTAMVPSHSCFLLRTLYLFSIMPVLRGQYL